MKKSILWVIGLLFSTSLMVTSCDETSGTPNPYKDWEERNQAYIDSISRVARANQGSEVGQWKVIHSYKFTPPTGALEVDVNDYVYCKVLKKGTGEITPLFTDSVTTHYRGQLIPLYNGSKVVFDQSFRGELDLDVAVPVTFSVGGVVPGWTTALQHMHEGDRWEVYVPYGMGYGKSAYSDIPGYSTLIFDMTLVKVKTNR